MAETPATLILRLYADDQLVKETSIQDIWCAALNMIVRAEYTAAKHQQGSEGGRE